MATTTTLTSLRGREATKEQMKAGEKTSNVGYGVCEAEVKEGKNEDQQQDETLYVSGRSRSSNSIIAVLPSEGESIRDN